MRIPFVVLFIMMTNLACLSSAKSDDWVPSKSLDNLKSNPDLPDLFTFENGQKMNTVKDWQLRRKEIKSILQYYQYGHLPPRPDRVTVKDFKSRSIPELKAIEERMTLVIGTEKPLHMRIAVYIPQKQGKLPVIVREEAELGHLEEVPLLMQRGFLFVEFAREDLDPDKNNMLGPAQKAYPNYDWATIAVWAWGAMRVVDYLESRSDVDLKKIGITGHSRGGKMALLAGAMDERFALVAPNGSGCGGAGCYRIQGKKCETLGEITEPERFSYWFHPRLRWFDGKEDRLPFDQHFLKALVAPRALICTDARDDNWANPLGTQATSEAALPAFELFNVAIKNGLHFRDGNHDLTPADWEVILDYAEWHFLNKQPDKPERFWSSLNKK